MYYKIFFLLQNKGQTYPTFQTQSYFNTVQDQKDINENNQKSQQHKYQKDSDNSIRPLQYQQPGAFNVETSEFMKLDNDPHHNFAIAKNDQQKNQQQQANSKIMFGNTPHINNQVPSISQKRDENQEILKQLKEFLMDKIEDVPLIDVYKNYQMLTNYCLKQQFLLQNKHYDPKTYFQGRKISEDDLNEVFNERNTQTQIDPQNVVIEPSQQYGYNNSEKYKNQSNEFVENLKKEQNQLNSGSPQTSSYSQNQGLGYAKYSQPTQMKKNSSNFSSTSTKAGQLPNSVTNSYINNSNQAIDISRSLLQSKNLIQQGSVQMINNYQDYSLLSDQNKCENINTQNVEKFTLSSQENKEHKKDQTQNYYKTNSLKNYDINTQNSTSDNSKNERIFANKMSFSPKDQIEQQIISFDPQGLEKNKSYIQQIRDTQDQQYQKNNQGIQQNCQKYFSSVRNAINSTQIQSPTVGILKNVQINLFSNKGNSQQSTDSSKRNDQMNSSGRLRSSNPTSPKNQKQDQTKNSFNQRDIKPISILKTSSQQSSNQILSPLSSTSQRNSPRKNSITNINFNNKSGIQSSKQQYMQFNENDQRDNSKERSYSNHQFDVFQKLDSGKGKEREKVRKSISIHLDQTKYYEYNNQSPVCKSTENKNQQSIDSKFKNSKFQTQTTSNQLKKDQIKLSNEINKISNILDFSKEFNELKYITSATQQIMNNSTQSKLNLEINQNKENNKSNNKKQQHYTIPLIKALNLTKLSSQPYVSEENTSQRETKDISMINSRNASPTHPQPRDKQIGSPRDDLKQLEAKRSSSLQPTPRENNDQKIPYRTNNRENSISRNIESVIQILNNKVKNDNQNSSTLRAINQSLSVHKSPMSPTQRNLFRGQTVISYQNSSTFQNPEANFKNSSQIFSNSNSTMHNNGSMSQKNLYQPQLSQKYSQIYQQMESLNQKFNSIGQSNQGQSSSNSNSNNTSQIFNQPIIFSQTNIINAKYQPKNNLRMTKQNF